MGERVSEFWWIGCGRGLSFLMQENVWPWAGKKLRIEAPPREGKEAYTKRAVTYLKSIVSESCKNYIRKMPSKIQACIAKGGQIGPS